MNQFIIKYRIITNRGGGFNAGNFVGVFWDDVADTTVVIRYTDALDNVGTVEPTGPDLGADRYDYEPVTTARPIPYKFCDGTTLNTFGTRSTYPYVNRFESENHFSCAVVVCDIRIVGAESTNASDETTADGSITVSADTSSPDAKYSLDPDFTGGGQLSGQFTGLLAGTYIVYAKDARGCSVSTTVIVGTPTEYATKYRLEYIDRNHMNTRLDILERGYTGEPIPVCGGPDPVVLRYNGDGEINRFKAVIPSEMHVTLSSPSNFYFRELFSQDERKYKIEYSKDFGVIQPPVDNIPDLDTFLNDDLGGTLTRPDWTTGVEPTVTLGPLDDDSDYLTGDINLEVGPIEVEYTVTIEDDRCTLFFRLYHTSDANEADEIAIPFEIGTHSGTFTINATAPCNRFVVIAYQATTQLPILSTWEQKPEENRQAWGTGVPAPLSILLAGQMTASLYCYYDFIAGQTYTIEITIDKNIGVSGSGASTLYVTGRTAAFFGTYTPFGQNFDGGDGIYTRSFTFIAPADMVIFALQIYHRAAAGNVTYQVTSVEITNTSTPGTTVTINSLESSTPGISGFQLKWTGFIISQIYSEPYDAPVNYPVNVVATDGLADLDKYDFVDLYGNKFQSDIVTLDAILSILRKTDLGINLITAVNRLEVSMTENALTESMINPAMFYGEDGEIEKCDYALDQLIKSFAVRLFQRNGKWIIQTIEEATHKFQAMEFSPDGEFIGSLEIEDITAITGPTLPTMDAAFRDRTQFLEVIPAYGSMSFEHSLIQNPSLIKSYSFEVDDVFITPDGVTAFKNWNVNIEDAPGAEYGIKETKSFEGDYNFFYKVPNIPYAEPGYTVVLTSTEGLIEYDATDLFEFKFDYSTITGKITDNPYGTKPHYPFWVRLKWSLKVGAYYFDDITGDWTLTKKYNDIYVDTFNDPQNYKIVAPLRDVSVLTLESFQVEFVFTDNNVIDVNITDVDYAELKAIPTVDLHEGYRVKARTSYTGRLGAVVSYLYFQLSFEDSDNDNVKTVRPDDYDEDDNIKVWVLQENDLVRRAYPRGGEFLDLLPRPSPEIPVKYQYLDNVVLRSLPGGNEPPENITIIRNNNLNIKIDFDDQFLLNDIDIENINNSERIYKNFFKKLDGSPTQLWERTYRAGQGKLLELFSADFLSQYKDPANKLTGSMLVSNEITFSTLLRELFDDNRLYMFMGMELHDREYSVTFDILELRDVVNDDTSGAIDAGFTAGFSLGFRA